MKICRVCNIEKKFEFFNKRKESKDGYRSDCKECHNELQKNRHNKNKNDIDYIQNRKDIQNRYYSNNKEEIYQKNKDYNKNWILENKDKKKDYNKKSYEKNREKRLENSKIYNEKNKDKINQYQKERLINNPIAYLSHKMRTIIYKSLNRSKISLKTQDILGCNFEEFKVYLESKFESWMTWDNKGIYNGELNHGWDIDHIIPLSSAKSQEDVIRLNHYTNLQPLCSKINRDIKKEKY
jgi:hypothetical protein